MLTCQKHQFQLNPQLTYLNCAYKSPFTHQVHSAGETSLRKNLHPELITSDDYFNDAENVKSQFAKIINEKEPQRIAIVPSVSYGMANVANNIRIESGNNIITISEQFPSNYYIWERICNENNAEFRIINAPEAYEKRGEEWNNRLLEAIDKNTKVVTLGHVHWTDGTRFDLIKIRQRCNEVGAYLIIDGTQSIGAFPFDNAIIQADAIVCAGYKWLMGPYNYGVAFYNEKFDNGKPIEESWKNRERSHIFSELVNYNDQYKSFANRYSVGESGNFILAPMLNAALTQINNWGVENIQQYCRHLVNEAIEVLRNKGFFIEHTAWCSRHLFGILIDSEDDLIHVYNRLQENKIVVSIRGNCIRISPHLYNDANDIDKLLSCF